MTQLSQGEPRRRLLLRTSTNARETENIAIVSVPMQAKRPTAQPTTRKTPLACSPSLLAATSRPGAEDDKATHFQPRNAKA